VDPTFAASWEGLLFILVLAAITGLSNWLQQRRKDKEAGWPPERRPLAPPRPGSPESRPGPPPVTAPPPPRPAFNWEEELRRLLEGEPSAPPTVEAAPPPTPSPTPPPPVRPTPVPAAPAEAPPPRPARPLAKPLAPPRSPVRFPEEAEALDEAPAPSFQLAAMEQSAAAHKRASRLDIQTTARLQAVAARTAEPVPAQPAARLRGRSAEAAQVVGQLRHPRSARQVVLASVILGPPKALE
jgi:hypothetical protein